VSEVHAHNTKEDGWMILNGWVLDVTNFCELHPGGGSVLAAYIGKDATEAFNDPQIHVHSKAAAYLLDKFRIGFIKGTKSLEEVASVEACIKPPSHFGVDINKGLLYQMAFIGDKYEEFLHTTLITHSEALRYFDHPVLEFFSRSPWWSVPLIWLPCTTLMFYWATEAGVNPLWLPLFIIAAPFVWNFFEYFIHKHLFHMEPKTDFFSCPSLYASWISSHRSDG